MDGTRRRCSAVVATGKGILVAAESNGVYCLPGGKIEDGESAETAVLRELLEETGLRGTKAEFLFRYLGEPCMLTDGSMATNLHEVYRVEAQGKAEPRGEIVSVLGYEQALDAGLEISPDAVKIIARAKLPSRGPSL